MPLSERCLADAIEGETEAERGRDHEVELGVVQNRFPAPLDHIRHERDGHKQRGETCGTAFRFCRNPYPPQHQRRQNPLQPAEPVDGPHHAVGAGSEEIGEKHVPIDRDADHEPQRRGAGPDGDRHYGPTPILNGEPNDGSQRNRDDVVFVEARRRHGEDRRRYRLAARLARHEPDKRAHHQNMTDQLGVVHAYETGERARHDGHEPQATYRGPGAAGAELPDHRCDQPTEGDHSDERERPPYVKRIAENLRKPADHIEGERRVVVDDERVGRRVERGRAHGGVGVIGVPALILGDLDRKADAPKRPHHEIDGEHREKRDLRTSIDAPQCALRHEARLTTRSSACNTSAGSGDARLPPTTAIGPPPMGPVKPGSLSMKIATSGTPSAAAMWPGPVSTPITNKAPAISAATPSIGRRSGTWPCPWPCPWLCPWSRPAATAMVSLRTRSVAAPQGSTTSKPRSRTPRATATQCASAHSLPGLAVA